jgi:hypothetical protein
VAVDAYDLVWRAHLLDSAGTPPITWIRQIYSRSVRIREQRVLRNADGRLFAGWEDAVRAGEPGAWVPTGIRQGRVAPLDGGSVINVGILGNFNHWATLEAARRVLSSSLAVDPRVRLVFAGNGSKDFGGARVMALGHVPSTEAFYSQVHCVVVPAMAGAGMKVKVAEAAVAGIPLVTSPIGAEGFPPQLRQMLTVRDVDEVDFASCEQAMDPASVDACAAAFSRSLGWEVAVSRYRKRLEDVQLA